MSLKMFEHKIEGPSPLLRIVDPVIASALIVFTFPLMVCVCLAIKLDSAGPVFCRHPRRAPDGRLFLMLKFRTAVHDPERPSRPIWDPGARETRLGRFLRYSRIEDLPQLINVLRGEMTLIGQGIEARNLRELAKLALWAAAAAIFGMLVKEGRFLELLAE